MSRNLKSAEGRAAQTPIPRGLIRNTTEYHIMPVDLTAVRSRDPLVRVRDFRICSDAYYARTDGLNPPYGRRLAGADASVRVRLEVAKRLRKVNRRLRRVGLELLVLDGYRSIACQRSLWKHFIDEGRKRHPGASEKKLERYALKYCADPRPFHRDDPLTWPSHVTGGAVDVTLKRLAGVGEQQFMGSIFDDAAEASHTAFFESARRRWTVSEMEAQKNRRLLYWSMSAEGFANLATEWWHYDWGTQLWAYVESLGSDRPAVAMYGPV